MQHTARTGRTLAAVFMLLSLLVTLSPRTAQALTLNQSTITVKEQGAVPNFPDTVDFTLKADGYETERATLNYSLVGDPVTAGVEADISGTTSNVDTKLTLDLATHYIPPGSQVSYYWTLTNPSGETIDTPAKTFKMLDSFYTWQSLTDSKGRVSVHWYEGNQAFGRQLLDTASSALDRLETEIKAGLDRPAEVWVYATQDALIDALPKNIPEWVGGKAFPSLALVLATISDDEYAESETKRVLPHELSHLVLYQATRNPYNAPPAWLDEGLAVHNQEWHDPAETEVLKQAAESGNLVPLKTLSGSFGADETAALLSYAESRSVADFIVTSPKFGPEKLAKTVSAFKGGVTYDEALKAGLGVTTDELDTAWRASLPNNMPTQDNAAPRPGQPNSPPAPAATTSWSTPFALATLAVFLILLVLGGAAVLIMGLRGRKT
ncbi:MAG: peptidase MA family metallohydrolase [Chloroflexota bacterium]